MELTAGDADSPPAIEKPQHHCKSTVVDVLTWQYWWQEQ